MKPELQQQQLGERELSLPARILLGQNCTSHVEGRPSTACQDSVEPELQQQQGRGGLSLPARILLSLNCTRHVEGRHSTAFFLNIFALLPVASVLFYCFCCTDCMSAVVAVPQLTLLALLFQLQLHSYSQYFRLVLLLQLH